MTIDSTLISTALTYLIPPALGVVVWLVRLEGRINQGDRDHIAHEKLIASQEKRIDTISGKQEALEIKVVQQLSEVKESLARIEGQLIK